MADWVHFAFQTAALASGVASLLAVSIHGRRREALRSIQTLTSRAAGRKGCSAADLPGESASPLSALNNPAWRHRG